MNTYEHHYEHLIHLRNTWHLDKHMAPCGVGPKNPADFVEGPPMEVVH